MTQQNQIAWPDVDASQMGDGPQAYDPGAYPVVLTKLTPISAKSGNPAVEFRARILEGKYEGRPLTWVRSLLPNAVWSFARDASAFLGAELPVNENGVIPGVVLAQLASSIEGSKAIANVVQQLYDDGKDHGLKNPDGSVRFGRYTSQVDSCEALPL